MIRCMSDETTSAAGARPDSQTTWLDGPEPAEARDGDLWRDLASRWWQREHGRWVPWLGAYRPSSFLDQANGES
jgi:hypothetical protein